MSIKLMTNEVIKIADKLTEELDEALTDARTIKGDVWLKMNPEFPSEAKHVYRVYASYDYSLEMYAFTFMMDDSCVFWYREDALKSLFCDLDLTTFIMACLGYVAMKENF